MERVENGKYLQHTAKWEDSDGNPRSVLADLSSSPGDFNGVMLELTDKTAGVFLMSCLDLDDARKLRDALAEHIAFWESTPDE